MDWNQICELFKKTGFLEVSMTSMQKPFSFDIYQTHLSLENYGNMNFLKQHAKLKKEGHFKGLKNCFVGIFPYFPHEDTLNSNLKVSVYAQSKDYHKSLEEKLNSIVEKLKKQFPENTFLSAVDSKPLLERDLAYKAGLGWIGKNTCLINKKHGSFFYIAEILTDLPLLKEAQEKPLKTDHCGTCTKCIDVCPTGALSPRKLKVEKCISYRNIEDRDLSSESLNKRTKSWFFGCDLCQSVCPWNEKKHGLEALKDINENFIPTEEALSELKDILSFSHKELQKKYQDYPLSRARGAGLKRNALKIIYENKILELRDFLKAQVFSEQLEDLRKQVIKSLS